MNISKNNYLSTLISGVISSIVATIICCYIEKNIKDYSIPLWLIFFIILVTSMFVTYHIGKRKNKKISKLKAIFFDFDGTLSYNKTTKSSWEMIWLKLGYTISDCQIPFNQYKEHKIDHQGWCDLTCKKFQEKHFNENMLNDIATDFNMLEGAIEGIEELKDKGIKIYLVSGSIIQLIKAILKKDIDSLFDGYKANKFRFSQTGELREITGTKYDFEGKAKYIQKIIDTEHFLSSEILFIGNSDNDEYVNAIGVQTLCINPILTNPLNKKIWKYSLKEVTHFKEIKDWISTRFEID